MDLSRRDFLWRGGALALAVGAGTLAPLDRLGLVERDELASGLLAPGSLRKCISLGGPGPLRERGHPDDYRLWGNREFFRSSDTRWVKLWVSWFDLQQELEAPPASLAESWKQLDRAPRGESWLRRLDAQVAAAKRDRIGVILTLYHDFPTWSSGAGGPDPVTGRKPPEARLPDDLSADSPWGWFVAHLCARYRRAAPRNPDRAWIDALEVCNEPNLLYWPSERVVEAAARMIRSAAQISARLSGPAILAPGTSDFPDQDHESERGLAALGWHGFTAGVLDRLEGFRPSATVRWSHHNFNDIKHAERPSRAERVIELLARKGWTTHVKPLWLTEGGLNLHPGPDDPRERERQARLIERNFRRMRRLGGVYLWTQHTISDKPGNDFKSGLRDDFVADQGPGQKRPAWRAWRDLPGSARL